MKIANHLIEVIGAFLLLILAFFVFSHIGNFTKNPYMVLPIFLIYIIVMYFMVKRFHKRINGLTTNNYIGHGHLRASLYSLLFLAVTWSLPIIILRNYDYTLQPAKEIINSGISNIIVGITEELAIRAFLFVSFLVITRRVFLSAVISSLLFAFLHSQTITSVNDFVNIFTGSMLLTYLYIYFNSIAAPIIFHFMINTLNSMADLPPAQDNMLVMVQTVCFASGLLLLMVLFKKSDLKIGFYLNHDLANPGS